MLRVRDYCNFFGFRIKNEAFIDDGGKKKLNRKGETLLKDN